MPLDSLKFPVHKDEALCTALKGHDLFSENFRDFTEAEVKHVFRITRVSGEDAVLPQESPQALCLCAPSGCGKTSMMKTALDQFNMNTDEAVFADSGQFRDCHQQYKASFDVSRRIVCVVSYFTLLVIFWRDLVSARCWICVIRKNTDHTLPCTTHGEFVSVSCGGLLTLSQLEVDGECLFPLEVLLSACSKR